MNKPSSAKKRKKDGESEEEESDLIQNSSEDEAEEEGELLSVSSTPPLKPFITDRWEWGGDQRSKVAWEQFRLLLLRALSGRNLPIKNRVSMTFICERNSCFNNIYLKV